MRKIERQMINALRNRSNMSVKNTRVEYCPTRDIAAVYLHDNRIARYFYETRTLDMTLAGWPTVTTRSRLNALCRAADVDGWHQADHVQHFGNVPVDADAVVSVAPCNFGLAH